MLRSLSLLAAVAVLSSGATQPPSRDDRPPALDKLDYFVGDWYEEADVKPGLAGPGGHVTMQDHREWMDGKFFVLIHSKFTALKGDGIGISLIGYDPIAKVYTWDEFYSQGEADHSKGSFDGEQWVWNMNDMHFDSKTVKARNIMKVVSPTEYIIRFETSGDGGKTWVVSMEGTGKKN